MLGQSISWYIGLVQAASALLTVVIYALVCARRKSKKNLKKRLTMHGFEHRRH